MSHLLKEGELSKCTGQAALKMVVTCIEEDERWEEGEIPAGSSDWEVPTARNSTPLVAEGICLTSTVLTSNSVRLVSGPRIS